MRDMLPRLYGNCLTADEAYIYAVQRTDTTCRADIVNVTVNAGSSAKSNVYYHDPISYGIEPFFQFKRLILCH